MALSKEVVQEAAPYLKHATVLSLGYPEFLISRDEAKEILDIEVTKLTNRGEWHKIKHQIPETQEVFKLLNSTFECCDIVQDFGIEKVVDLNYPHDLGKFTLVIDPGTIEHCFNIGQAVMNAANAVIPGGHIIHTPPMTLMNHGFWNVCPTALWDFYEQNGWTIKTFMAIVTNDIRLHTLNRFLPVPEYSLLCIAQRNTLNQLKWPMQAKYVKKYEKAA